MQCIALLTIASGVFVLLGWFTLPVRVVLLTGALTMLAYRHRARFRKLFDRMIAYCPSWSTLAIGCAVVASAAILWMSGTTDPIRSPWSVVSAPFFLLFAALTISATRARFGTSVALLISSLVAILVYPIGFGFDHFIHAAAERIIIAQGSLTPPPFFYSGYYGLVGLLATIPGITVAFADRIIVPLFVAIAVAPFVQRSLRAFLPNRTATVAASSLLIVPFLPLAVSTPQALANAFGLIAIVSLATRGPTTAAALTAIATLLAQPLTGIPVAAAVAAAWWFAHKQRAIGIATAVLGAIAIPIAFVVAQIISPQLDIRTSFAIGSLFGRLGNTIARSITITAADFSHADALTIAHTLIPLLWIALALAGTNILRRERHPVAPFLFGPLIAIGASALVAMTITAASQLSEEQTQFPIRLLALAALLAMPLVGVALAEIAERMRNRAAYIAFTIVFGVLATTNLILAYPRDDAQERSGLWSVSADDIIAVHTIALDAGDHRYVVLANQMLGAAAIQEFGFRPSYVVCKEDEFTNGHESTKLCREVLAFPLPAGGPIARDFWMYVSQQPVSPVSTIVETGDSRKPIDAAIDLVDADRAYVVLHDYWRNYNQLVAATTLTANGELLPLRQGSGEQGQLPHLRIFRFEAQKQKTMVP